VYSIAALFSKLYLPHPSQRPIPSSDYTMASILPYVSPGAVPGQKLRLKIKKFVWLTVGDGELESLSDYEVTVDGTVDVMVYKGDLRIQVLLLDKDPEADSGPCILNLNSHSDENATYQVNNGAIVISAAFGDKKQQIAISRYNKGSMTECNLSGYLDIGAYLEAQ
jgi:hypothetical protein